MSESKHTPEPWRINLLDETAILGADGSDVVTTDLGDYEQYYLTFEANARRIVACVNACTGIPTEALEAGVVAEMVEALKFYQNNWNANPSKSGIGLEWSPREALLDDCGNRARTILAKISGAS